jgi:hypothetical protein
MAEGVLGESKRPENCPVDSFQQNDVARGARAIPCGRPVQERPPKERKHMVQGKWFAPGEDLSAAVLPVRTAVFGRGADDLDALSWNALVYQDGVPAASGRIWWEDGAYRLGDIGVLESYRSQRLGDLVLRLLLFKAQSHAAKEVRLQSPRDVAGFFARLGLKEESVDDTGLVEMMIPGEDIDLDTCRHCPKASCPNRK